MEVALVVSNSNSSDNGTNDVSIKVNSIGNSDDINKGRNRISDTTLEDIFYEDVWAITFLKLAAFHWETDHRDHPIVSMLLIVWKVGLLVLAGIGFMWQVFLGFNVYVYILVKTSPYENPADYFNYICLLYINLAIPIIQVIFLIYSMVRIKKFIQLSVNRTLILNLLPKTKRITSVYTASMVLLTVIVSASVINLKYYESVYYNNNDVKDRSLYFSYSLYALSSVTMFLFLNISEILFTAIALLVFSLQLEQIQTVQQSILNSIDQELMTADYYYQSKERIKSLVASSFFAIQLLTCVAGLNWIGMLIGMLSLHTMYVSNALIGYTYNDMIKDDFVILPYLLKEALFFFYVLYKATSINTLDDKIKRALVKSCDTYAVSSNDIDHQQHRMYTSLSLNAIMFPTEFKLLGRRVTRNDIAVSVVGSVIYSISMIIKVDNTFS